MTTTRCLFPILPFALCVALALAAGCGNGTGNGGTDNETGTNSPSGTGNGGHHGDHGDLREIGSATIAGLAVTVSQAGHIHAGAGSAFDIDLDGNVTAVRGWIGTGDRTASPSGVGKAEAEGAGWHLHIDPMQDLPIGAPLWIEVEAGGETGTASFPVVYAGPHDGVLAGFSGAAAGTLELKLHDDKGDLELWIASDAAISQPLDLPLDASITVTFPGRSTSVTLMVRNREQNEDEEGTPTIRNGQTNYFIFPGDTGEDAAWLCGTDFEATVTVSFPHNGGICTTEPFTLVPHHHTGGDHGHEH